MGDWFELVGSAVPRGFSRYYALKLLAEAPRTGKEIMDSAAEHSGGRWRPSPGLIYPLLGRLSSEGIVEEDGGRYKLTEKGRATASDVDRMEEAVKRQLEVLARLGSLGRFGLMDVLERVSAALGEGCGPERYREFLRSELDRLGEGKRVPID